MSSYLHCGTPKGVWEHQRDAESCQPCKEYWISLGRPKIDKAFLHGTPQNGKPKPTVELAKCGTESGYRAHLKRSEYACDKCTVAHEKYREERRKDRLKPTECGTYPGYAKHRYLKETPCDECKEAKRIYQREQRAKKRQAKANA